VIMALLEVDGLTVRFTTYEGEVHAVEDVSYSVNEGEFFGLVGETGCGKSVSALSLLDLLATNGRVESGSANFEGKELIGLPEKELRRLRGDAIAYIFQEPLAALNPVLTVSRQITEVLLAHRLEELVHMALGDNSHPYLCRLLRLLFLCPNRKTRKYVIRLARMIRGSVGPGPRIFARCLLKLLLKVSDHRAWRLFELPLLGKWFNSRLQPYADALIEGALAEVGLPDPTGIAKRYPHELSGGMAQRVMVAMALAGHPRLLIADEPTTALDVTIQAQFLDLLREIQSKRRFSVLLITHNLGVVRRLCHRVAVMYAGQIIEQAPVEALFNAPHHPYTRGLLAALPKLKGRKGELTTLPGAVPDLLEPPMGCRFAPRCSHAIEVCAREAPPLREVGDGHSYYCHLDKGGRDG